MPGRVTKLATTLALYMGCLAPSRAAPPARGDAVYEAPTGLALLSSDHSGRVYGATTARANWDVAQWGIPEDLPGFDSAGTARNRAALVSFSGNVVTLQQDTSGSPCERVYPTGRKQVYEFDLFLQPNKRKVDHLASAARDISRRISDLSQILHTIRVEPTRMSVVDNVCKVTKVGLLTAIVLTNRTSRQTFFYQLRLGQFRLHGTNLSPDLPPPGWYFTGQNTQSGRSGEFGFGDDITVMGNKPARLGEPATYRVDLLPRMRALLVAGGRYGMDQNLKNWTLSGTYHGTNAFGHVAATTRWSEFSLTAR